MMRVACIVASMGLCACTTISPEGMTERHYFGYVKLIVPDSLSKSSRVSASEVTALGIRIENGVGVGYFHDKEIAAPLDCRLVLMVRDKRQLDDAARFLNENYKGESACAVINQ